MHKEPPIRMNLLTLVICVCLTEATWDILYSGSTPRPVFQENWNDLDTRRLPHWYDMAKIGILVHWGIYSVPGYSCPEAQDTKYFSKYMMKGNKNVLNFVKIKFGKEVTYEDLARQFKPTKFDPDQWTTIFKNAGAKYVIITAKDGDGFTLFPSVFSPGWNAKEIGPKNDIVGQLKSSLDRQGLVFGIYYYLFDWFKPDFVKPEKRKLMMNVKDWVKNLTNNSIQKARLELEQLVINYKPMIIWADGNSLDKDVKEEIAMSSLWNATSFLSWLYSKSPVGSDVVVNDRWDNSSRQQHGDFFSGPNFNSKEKYYQNKKYNPRKLQEHKWEHLISLDPMSLGYRKIRPAFMPVMHPQKLIETVVATVSCGGNVLINVGVTDEGIIPQQFIKPLRLLGKWLDVNGEAIYGTSPWGRQNESNGNIWYTCKTDKYNGRYPLAVPYQPDVHTTYVIFFEWPSDNILMLDQAQKLVNRGYKVRLLGNPGKVYIRSQFNRSFLFLPEKRGGFAWTLKFSSRPERLGDKI